MDSKHLPPIPGFVKSCPMLYKPQTPCTHSQEMKQAGPELGSVDELELISTVRETGFATTVTLVKGRAKDATEGI